MTDHLALVTGEHVEEILTSVLAGVGGRLLTWSPRSVHHQPEASTTACYRTLVDWGARTSQETLVISAGQPAPPAGTEGIVLLGDGHQQVVAWRFPTDPDLPGLAVATDPHGALAVLSQLKVPGFNPARGPVRVLVRTFRPRRRAVVQVDAGEHTAFLRVLRPAAAAHLHERHALLHSAGVPVPRSWGSTQNGLLALEALRGRTLREQLAVSGPTPSGSDLLDLLACLPETLLALPAQRSWADDTARYARVLAETLPAERTRARGLASAIGAGLAGQPADSPTHGDFHDAQLMVMGPRIAGLLDVEAAGPGRRADDLATLLAHLEARILGGAPDAERLRGLVDQWLRSAEQVVDADELRLRVAGVLLALATGPYRRQRPGWVRATSLYLQAVERWATGCDPRGP